MKAVAPALELRAIRKTFGRAIALDDASLTVRAGTLHMLVGENGAGKTTLVRVASGSVLADAGEILLNGARSKWASPAEAIEAGIGVVHQHFSLVSSMTVAENVALIARSLRRRFSPRAAAQRVRHVADEAGLPIDPDAVVGTLSVAAQQHVELIKAIAHRPGVLMLDEPTASLSPTDSAELFAWLRRHVAAGNTAVVITHRIREALEHGDAITVMRDGRTVLAAERGTPSETTVLAAILGESGIVDAARRAPVPDEAPAEPLITLRGVDIADAEGAVRLRGVTLTVHGGEILGVAAVDGAGQYELLRTLAGRLQPVGGEFTIPSSLGFVPEDRLRDALVGDMTLAENFALRGAGARAGVVNWAELAAEASRAATRYDVRGADAADTVAQLSGGNQQKLVLARELGPDHAVLIAENPVRGLDVRAAAAVIDHLRAARAAGSAVVIYSRDIDELVALADRIVVCHGGLVREVAPDATAVGAAMVGAG